MSFEDTYQKVLDTGIKILIGFLVYGFLGIIYYTIFPDENQKIVEPVLKNKQPSETKPIQSTYSYPCEDLAGKYIGEGNAKRILGSGYDVGYGELIIRRDCNFSFETYFPALSATSDIQKGVIKKNASDNFLSFFDGSTYNWSISKTPQGTLIQIFAGGGVFNLYEIN